MALNSTNVGGKLDVDGFSHLSAESGPLLALYRAPLFFFSHSSMGLVMKLVARWTLEAGRLAVGFR
jgi:hypothetical protein